MRRQARIVLAILVAMTWAWTGLGADTTPPDLTVPPDVTIECYESTDPSNTGQATATDDTDPNPVVTYEDQGGYGTNAFIRRTWTATDDTGNSSSGEQVITILSTSVTILGVTPEIATSLPTTFTISFTVADCATEAKGYLQGQTVNGNDYFGDSRTAVTADGATVNTVEVTIPAGADDDVYRLARLFLYMGNVTMPIAGPWDFVIVGASPEVPELTSVEISAPMSYFLEYPREDETIRIEFTSTIPLADEPVVTILGRSAVVTHVSHQMNWEAQILLLASDPERIADFTIDFESLAGVAGDQVAETTDGSWVLYDRTPPSTPVLVEPEDGATENHGSVYFLCEESTDTGSGIWRYHWYDSNGNSRTTSRSHAHDYDADDTFTWWMTAEDYAGNHSTPSPSRTLNILLTPELLITETGGSTNVTEGVPAVDLVKVQFNSDPGTNVDLIVTPDAQLDVGEGAGTPYTFHYIHGVDAWTRQFEIETGAVDDALEENMHSGTLLIETSCAGNPGFDGLSKSVTVTITDNDDYTAPVLTIPPDVTIGCDEPTLPANTGQATATDNMDPSPSVTYTDSHGSTWWEYRIYRTWTATDASGNTSSDVQQITVTGQSLSVVGVDPEWTNSLPATFTISYTVEGCSMYALGLLSASTQSGNYFGDSYAPFVADGSTVNTIDVTIPAGAAEDMYELAYIDLCEDPNGHWGSFMMPGPDPLVGVDFTPPVLTIPADVTVACEEPTEPSDTGQATATDNLDPDPTVTYTDSHAVGLDFFIRRTWTATDAAGNSTSAMQEITVTRPGMTAVGVSQAWVGELPTTVTIWFTLEKCATEAMGYLNGLSYGPSSDHWSDDFVAVVSDGVTVNAVDVTLPADADEDEYMLVIFARDAEHRAFNARGPFAFVTVDLTDPVLTVPAEVLIVLGDSTHPSNTGQATATDNYDPSPTITYTDSAILPTAHPEVGLIERTWRAEDAAGNFDEGLQLIRVDLTPPVAMAVVPAGGAGAEAILDLVLDLAEGEDPPMIGTLPLSAIYIIGEPITGACSILDGAGDSLTDSRIFLYLYLVTIDGLTETRTEVASALITCDRTTGTYCFHLETTDLEPGIYDVYLGFEDGSSQILRIELQAAPD